MRFWTSTTSTRRDLDFDLLLDKQEVQGFCRCRPLRKTALQRGFVVLVQVAVGSGGALPEVKASGKQLLTTNVVDDIEPTWG